MDYAQAFELHKYFLQRLAPACDRIMLVGSLRRADNKVMIEGVHDFEFLLIPDPRRLVPVFGGGLDQPKTALEKVIRNMKDEGLIQTARNKADGEKMKRFAIVKYSGLNDFCLEIFIVKPETWAIQAVIRTGPRIFSKRFVNNESFVFGEGDRKLRGLLPNHLEYVSLDSGVNEGTFIRDRNTGIRLVLKEEEEAIGLLGLGWIPPERRYQYT